MERPDWNPGDRIRSFGEVSSIMLEAGKLCVTDTVKFVRVKAASGLARIDEWLADYGDEA